MLHVLRHQWLLTLALLWICWCFRISALDPPIACNTFQTRKWNSCVLHSCFPRPDLCAKLCIVTKPQNYFQLAAALADCCILAGDDSDCFSTVMCQAVMVLGLSPNICIDKGYFNGNSGLGQAANTLYGGKAKLQIWGLSFILLSERSCVLWVARILSSEMKGAPAKLLLGKVTQWVEVKMSQRAFACIHRTVLNKLRHKIAFSSLEV